jgi:hypothetical protein
MNKNWPGFYRGKIVKIDEDKMNGVYYVKVYPMFANYEDDKLPPALSNMTNSQSENPLEVGEWVWCFFENFSSRTPIIFDRCNIKDQYPDFAKGEEPDYWGDLEKNDDIEETEIEYEAEYGTATSYKFGDNIHVDIDTENELILIKTSTAFLCIDKEGSFHIKGKNTFITNEEKFNIGVESLYFKIGDSIELTVNGDDGIILDDGTNKIEMTTEGVIINENFKVLNT